MHKFILFCALIAFSSVTYAVTQVDTFKQYGGIAAVANTCYGSTRISKKLNPMMKQIETKSNAKEVNDLLDVYNASYNKAIADNQVWMGAKSDYAAPIDCSKDIAFIQQMEGFVLNNLH